MEPHVYVGKVECYMLNNSETLHSILLYSNTNVCPRYISFAKLAISHKHITCTLRQAFQSSEHIKGNETAYPFSYIGWSAVRSKFFFLAAPTIKDLLLHASNIAAPFLHRLFVITL